MPYVGRTPSAVPVTVDDIPANSIDASKIVDGSIELAEIADNSITDAKLNSSKLDGIEAGATNYIHPTTHATADIADNAITDAKLNSAKLNGIEAGATADQTSVSGSSGSCTGNSTTASSLKLNQLNANPNNLSTLPLGRTSNYAGGYWTNGPSGMSYGSVYNFGGQTNSGTGGGLSLEVAADVVHNSTSSTRKLWFRTSNNLGFQNDWKEIWHAGNSTAAKAWVYFDGTSTVAIADSHNVSSVTDVGAGKYNVNFTTAMATTSYAVALSAQKTDSNDDGNAVLATEHKGTNRVRTASMFPVFSGDWFIGGYTGAAMDANKISVIVFGD